MRTSAVIPPGIAFEQILAKSAEFAKLTRSAQAAMAQLQQSSKDEIETESKQKPKRFAALPFTGVISPKARRLRFLRLPQLKYFDQY